MTPKVDLNFSTSSKIDTSGFALRDPRKPFFFNLQPSGGGTAYKFTADIGTLFDVWLDREVPTGSSSRASRSLGFKITADEDLNVKDKIMLNPVLYSSDNHLDLAATDTVRYFSFDFMLDPHYEVPRGWLLHMQVWQCCTGHPPLTLHVTPGTDRHGPVELTVDITNDSLEAEKYGKYKPIFRMLVQRGVWNKIALMLEPHFDSSELEGGVDMWFNGKKQFSYKGSWGFQPDRPDPVSHAMFTSQLGISLGIYRRRQTTTQTIYFDNIRYGCTLSSVVSSE